MCVYIAQLYKSADVCETLTLSVRGDCLMLWREQLHTGRRAVMTVCSGRSAPTPVARCQPAARRCAVICLAVDAPTHPPFL